ncbi:LacI family DNA-binding transcriptional regulator [Gimibacter soli]|uniref:LacI family DNA-binding transcriptional regulator n=1 Tax=Gimibacter soli TaxID=3024400 RepID=A0AAF0BMB7_9PROT|nr:LacI family DNA-binding transcriptional regulator [Gimibacter soli]WCL55322.1 LacI family DNA-binding transcriptional regulator [Gimibacter soli]
MAPKSKPTIIDVARVAGVSVTTVSRVLNGGKYVSPDKLAAVQEAFDKLDYQPNLHARSLAGERAYLIGLLFDDPRGDYLSGMQRGTLLAGQKADYHVLVELLGRTGTLAQMKRLISRVRLSGVILTPPVCDHTSLLNTLVRHHIPAVRISPSSDFPGIPSVKIDDYAAATEMTRHLITLGHRKIGFIIGDPEHADARERQRAFNDALAKAGLEAKPEWVAEGGYQFSGGLTAARKILSQPDRPTAIFASNDDMAAAVIAVADEMGLRVPADLSVSGFDDTSLASAVSPALTTIRQPVEQMAMKAVEILLERISGEKPETETPVMMGTKFVRRGSTGPAPQ